MTLLPASEFSIRSIGPHADAAMPRSEIMVNGHPTGKVLEGAILEMALQCCDFRLALLTDNILHEDTLRIYLLDANLNVLDWARLGAMYATGAFSLIALLPPNRLRFHFFGGAEWMLAWRHTPAFAVPVVSDPRGVRRPWRCWRRLQINGRPGPERYGDPGL